VEARHLDVEQHRLRWLGGGELERGGAVGGLADLPALLREGVSEHLADDGRVVGDEHVAHGAVTRCTRPSSSSAPAVLARKASAPAPALRRRASSSVRDETTTIPIPASSGCIRIV